MRVLFDNCTPEPLSRWLLGHEISTCRDLGWTKLTNGELVTAAEKAGFDLIVTCDTNLKYQQNLRSRHIAIVQLTTNHWPSVEVAAASVFNAVNAAKPGTYETVTIRQLPRTKSRRLTKS